ncbi:MAG: hypothetical protein DRJ97_06960 [Thermoprotei archaeon]|nr:MAG: hypothetical protein DRJ97_06960 [Thermoprotei archaeon]
MGYRLRRDIVERARKLILEEGGRALEEARREVSRWRVASPEARRALREFMSRWRDYTRPAIIRLSCKAVGGDVDATLKVASALILVSGAFDLHDDIIDRSYVRGPRRRKTILGRYGENIALLVGDALLLRGTWLLSRELARMKISRRRVEEILDLLFELGVAEALELRFVGKLDVKPDEYLKVVELKAADVEAYAKLGGVIGGGSEDQVEALGLYGRRLGMIAIVRDDLEDLLNYKVELKSRIMHESLPLPLVYALNSPGHREDVLEALSMSGDEGLRRLVKVVEKSGGIDATLNLLSKLVNEAEEALDRVGGDVEGLRLLVKAAVPVLEA